MNNKTIKNLFTQINYNEIEKEIVTFINQFPKLISNYQKIRDQLNPDEFENILKTNPKTNLKALERWSVNVINGNRINNYKFNCKIISECSNAIGFFYDYSLFSQLSRDIGSSHFLQELQTIIMHQTTSTNRMLMHLRFLLLHFTPSIADHDQFSSEIQAEMITEVDNILVFDLISLFEVYNDKSEDIIQLIFKQGGQLEDSRKMMLDVDMDFIRNIANELDLYIHSMKCFVDYMKKNYNFIQNLRDIIENPTSINHH